MLISFMSFLVMFKFWLEFILGSRGEHQVMLTHSHNFELFIPICEEVKKIYRDHPHRPKDTIILYHHTDLHYTTLYSFTSVAFLNLIYSFLQLCVFRLMLLMCWLMNA